MTDWLTLEWMVDMAKAVVEMHGVTKTFGDGSSTISAVADLSLMVHPGEVVWLQGDSGSGKSTALNIAGLLTRPDSGDVLIDGTALASASEGVRGSFRRDQIGFVFQSHNLIPYLSAFENVVLASDTGARADRARELLDSVGLTDRLNTPAKTLSGGEQQRVAVARALLNLPVLLIADEPISGLDEGSAATVLRLLRAAADEGRGCWSLHTSG